MSGDDWAEEGYEGNPNCEHVYEYSNISIDIYPPVHHACCKKCGRIIHVEDCFVNLAPSKITQAEE